MSRSIHVHQNHAGRAPDEAGVRQLGEIMQTRVVTIGPKASAGAAWTRMRRRGIRHLVVTDHERLVGVVSERDLGGRAGAAFRKGRSVRDVMTPRVLRAEASTSLRDAADQMRTRLIGSLPVVEGEQLVGIVTATDVFDALRGDGIGPLSGAERQLLRAPTSSKRLGGRTISRSRSRAGGETSPLRRRRVPKSAPELSSNIRVSGVTLDDDDRAFIRKKLGTKLGKFATAIERVSVRVEDVNGPRGGVDQRCRIKVVLGGLPSVVFESRAASTRDALDGALTGAERAVRRALRRTRMQPIKRKRRAQRRV